MSYILTSSHDKGGILILKRIKYLRVTFMKILEGFLLLFQESMHAMHRKF